MRCPTHCPKPSSKLASLICLAIVLASVSTVLTTVGNALNFLDHFIWPLFILAIIGTAGALRLAGFVIQACLPRNRVWHGPRQMSTHEAITGEVPANVDAIPVATNRPAIESGRQLPPGMGINQYWESMAPVRKDNPQ